MMDRNYPSSSFADGLAPPADTAASWAYDRGSASIKPSYGASHLDGELLQHQSYTSAHQLPSYTTTHIPAGAGTLESSSVTPVTSIMSFLSAMESRSLRAGPVSASLLPPFRPPSWTSGSSSSSTELYLTGALPSTATFPSPAALPPYQHTAAYPSRSFATNSSLDPAFSTSTNGLVSHHDPLLHLKSTQAVLPAALAFNHLSGSSLGSALPVQSSTYRSAQESAPHLLQPQFSLLPSAAPAAPQPYGATIFSGSIERALQRECSVIKHHQRPSSSHVASEQLPDSEHSLRGYFGSGNEADLSYQQDLSGRTPVSSTRADSSREAIVSTQPKPDCATEVYLSTSLLKPKDFNSKLSDMSNSLPQTFTSDKLSSLYTTLPSDNVASVSQMLVYSSASGLSQEQEIQYRTQVQSLCRGNLSESYPTSHSHSQQQVSASPSHSFASERSLTSSFPPTCVQSLPTSSYSHIEDSAGGKGRNALPQQQTQTHLVFPSFSPNHQALQNNIRSPVQDIKSAYGKQKLEELPLQVIEAIQQASMFSASDSNMISHNNVIYVMSKMEDHKLQGVIRSHSQSDEQLVSGGRRDAAQVKGEQVNSGNRLQSRDAEPAGTKTTNSIIVPFPAGSEQHALRCHESHQQTHTQSQGQSSVSQTPIFSVPDTQVLLDPSQMILVQPPLMHSAQNASKSVSVQSVQPNQGLSPIHVRYLQMDQDLLGSGVPETPSAAASESSSSSSKHHYSQSTKNPFALNSICFPDTLLLVDDGGSILSNVDDILAATVAACGVTPQDFAKAASSAEMAAMGSPDDSKGQLQIVDLRHASASFSSTQHPALTDAIGMTLNGAQTTADGHNGAAELDKNGDRTAPENGFHSTARAFDSSIVNRVKDDPDDALDEHPSEDSPKKKTRSKSESKPGVPEDDRGRPAKRNATTKRQNSRNSDAISPSTPHDGCPQQERIKQKIREVEEKQPEVKTGFIGSFLDFIKSGPKHSHSSNAARAVSRQRKPSSSSKTNAPPSKVSPGTTARPKRLDEELQENLGTLPTFSSDEEESTGKNQALRNSISSALSALDDPSDHKPRTENQIQGAVIKLVQVPTVSQAAANPLPPATGFTHKEDYEEIPAGELAARLVSVAVEGLTDEELSDSGGEGMYRERDDFVVRNEDVETLKVTMTAGIEPPAIWKVQKALLQKFVPELRDGRRVFSATNSYLGYFGDAQTMYRRVYVKFLDTVNKREYVRVCSRKPRCKPMNCLRGAQVKSLLALTALPSQVLRSQKPRPRPNKSKAEPPPKKRRKWKEFSHSSGEEVDEDDEFNPPPSSRLLNTRTMKETFRSFVELLVSMALDDDVITTLERANDELLLPHMKRLDGMIADNRKRLLHHLRIGQVLKTALDSFPEISVVTEPKKDGGTSAFKVCLSGKTYNKKTMKTCKMPSKVPQEFLVDQQKTPWFSLYHSLQHYKYHTYLTCKEQIGVVRARAGDLGQEETVQECLQNHVWVDGMFDGFGELIGRVQQVCR